MGTEIERKFLVTSDAWRTAVVRSTEMRQGYLAGDASCSVRVRIEGDRARLNIKSATLGIERLEYEYELPMADAREMLETFCGDRLVEKSRHYVPQGPITWEIDEFGGLNSGLVVAEVELTSVDQSISLPPWLGEEVSEDPRYYNVQLIDHPYSRWA